MRILVKDSIPDYNNSVFPGWRLFVLSTFCRWYLMKMQIFADQLHNLVHWLSRLARTAVIVICVAMTLAIGLLDYAKGYELDFHLFYFAPIAISAWQLGRSNAIRIAVLSVITWLTADLLSNHPLSSSLIVFWNTGIQASTFLIIAFVVAYVRTALDREQSVNSDLSAVLIKIEREIHERTKAEEKIIEQSEFLKHAFESVTHPFYVLDANDYTIMMANSAVAPGYLPPNTTCFALTHRRDSPCGSPEHLCPIETIKRTRQSLTTEHVHYNIEGIARHVEVHAHPILDGDGNVVQIIEYSVDITERKRMEEALRCSEEKYRNLFENAGVAMFRSRLDGSETLDVNEKFLQLVGRTREETQGKPSVSFWEDPEKRDEMVRRLVADGRVSELEFKMLNKREGEVRDCITSLVLYREQGILEGAIFDITERKRAELALSLRESYLAAILENQPGLVWLKDNESRFLAVNHAFARSCGKERPEDVLGKTDLDLWPRELAEKYRSDDKAVMNSGAPIAVEEPVYDQGETKWFETFKTPVVNEEGRIIGTTGYARDITERKQMEETLRRSHEELELRVSERTSELDATVARLQRLNEELQEFAFIASHDLQEPLRKIQTFGNMLIKEHKGALNHQGQDYMDRITKSANRMSELLRSLLAYSRSSTSELNYELVSLSEVARKAASDLEILIDMAKGSVEIGELPTVNADATLLRQLFHNLIGNSIKYRKESEPPVVKIYGEITNATCHVMIEDNGIGFGEEYTHQIFKPFERLHGKNSPYSGTGMGLAICRKIVERHGWRITARSVPEQGATLIITLPIEQKQGVE